MRVDWHSHVWLPEHLGPVWGPELDENVHAHPSADGSPEAHLAAMDEAGVDAAVVLGLVACEIDLDIPNEFIAEHVSTDPSRLIGFGSVDPNDPKAVDKVRYAATDLGLKGIKLSPPYQGFHPHSDEAMRVYREAADHGMTITFHQGGVFLRSGYLEFAQPVLLDRVAREFRDTRIIIAHAGQPWAHETTAVMFKNPNVWTDLSARYGRPAQLRTILRGLIDYGVESRVLFGSDFPIYRPSECIAQLRGAADGDETGADSIGLDVVEAIIDDRPLSLFDWQ
ncbi:amidohydrolase family protein [Ruicaihuangia caeni]|uniref:Amidohydrolase family protein n=1 Tax=Ruicaihuangia caeni TaxID=3042517 RepID=A0AAW6TBC9_9MICO|nr:amidohydrolase family protein [Klugiella sp. YN-L-19]MDI2099138.1 amidohydrolase family protein [Klugiella sp. YN-L-19]